MFLKNDIKSLIKNFLKFYNSDRLFFNINENDEILSFEIKISKLNFNYPNVVVSHSGYESRFLPGYLERIIFRQKLEFLEELKDIVEKYIISRNV